eukprot:scaffold30938_cov20-Tisochrysis_lutea.AAC.2
MPCFESSWWRPHGHALRSPPHVCKHSTKSSCKAACAAHLQSGLALYTSVFYAAPTPGAYHVHVGYNELGTTDFAPIRGSPFNIYCADPWVKHRVMGK